MRRIAILLLLVTLAGCKGTVGPLASRQRDQRPDPLYNSEEQQRFSRERYPYIEQSPNLAPNTFTDRPSPTGR